MELVGYAFQGIGPFGHQGGIDLEGAACWVVVPNHLS